MDPAREASAAFESARDALARVDRADLDALLDAIDGAARVFVAGAGRTGLMARAFACRLAQIGIPVHVAGAATTPAIGAGDLLLAASASGTRPTVTAAAGIARASGARVAAIGADAVSPLATGSDLFLHLPGVGLPGKEGQGPHVLGSRFELALHMLLDVLAAALMARRGVGEEEMRRRHANLE